MLPKWFDVWNRKNPTNIFGPAILIGVMGGAVFVVAMLVAFGQPYATASVQTGPRGTGMDLTKRISETNTPDPTLALYADTLSDPIIPTGTEPLAKAVYKNVQVLGDVTEDNFNRTMLAITQWVAPEQGCAYCHGDGALETYGEDTLYTKVVARRMLQMTQNLNENWSGHVNVTGNAGVNCFTCHRGQNVPSGIWYRIAPINASMAGWGAVQNQATIQSQYTSLPSDALEAYLLNGENINVHDLESRVARDPSLPTVQNAERTFSLMNYFSNSLNVNCTFCHNTRAFYDPEQVTPQWATALLGIEMVKELNTEYLAPLVEVLPPNRLGPVYADAPKAACLTCHKEYQKPMGGADMISQWPELAASGKPVYE